MLLYLVQESDIQSMLFYHYYTRLPGTAILTHVTQTSILCHMLIVISYIRKYNYYPLQI